MAQPTSSPKIEELRFRLKTDPKSRLFYPLAEELRRIQQHAEAEQVLRLGLTIHPTYLSAWVSLGRVLREQGKNAEAVEPLSKALTLDPGNVVAARALADAYLALGEKVEAIKKYKLVHALLPSDQDVTALIEQLDREINPPVAAPEPAPPPEPAVPSDPWSEQTLAPGHGLLPPMPTLETPFGDVSAFAESASAHGGEQGIHLAAGDHEPMAIGHTESPFEEPAAEEPTIELDDRSDSRRIEQPGGMPVAPAPQSAEVSTPMEEQQPPDTPAPPEPFLAGPTTEETADFFAPPEEPPAAIASPESYIETGIASDLPFALESTLPPLEPDDFAKTITMADLYAGQGLVDEARDIYEDILARDPSNESVRAKLEVLSSAPQPAEVYQESDYDGEEGPEPEATATFLAPAIQPEVFEQQEGQTAAMPAPSFEGYQEQEEPAQPFAVAREEREEAATSSLHEELAGGRSKIARLQQWLTKVGRREVNP